MAKNRVQFQKGLSWVQFRERYGTVEQCADALARSRWPRGFECPECGSRRFHLLKCRALYQCAECHRQTSITAGTVFACTKLPLTVWFLAMHLLSASKHGISSLELGRQVGISQKAAWSVKHKLMQVMLEREQGRILSGRVEADDAYMGGEAHGGKVGRGAGRKRPFLAAVQTSQDRKPLYLSLQALKQVSGRAILKWGKAHLHPGAEVVTDGWKSYRSLDANGWSHEAKQSDTKGWRRAKHPAFKWVNTILGNLKANLLGVCRAIRLKHLPRYLAEFQYRFNRRFDLSTILQRLLRASVLTPPMPYRLLKLAEIGG
jgi:DNA-directed RNA polymerase subunit RPC12/RpoP/transposase-like protein